MPMYDYKCDKCGFTDEYNTSFSLPKDMRPPDKCPKCKKGKMEQQFSMQNINFDVIGGTDYADGGRKNWKSRMTPLEQSQVLAGEKSPY